MIIREIKINSFGGLKDFEINLNNGINIIYGENEKGKSTTEEFIKIMLYGFSKKKINGESERKRYIPFDGGVIGGELLIEHRGKEYIIKRTFGLSKKEDKSIIIDAVTGEEISEFNKEEPGRNILEINRSTFEKTIFISQLGVVIKKDKEEEIIQKVTSLFGCGDEEMPISKAMEKLESLKKSLTTVRGAGELDLLVKKQQKLFEEQYEANKLCEKNLEWEEQLYLEKNKRKELEDEILKLEVYKKYLKRSNLQKEYKEIAEYLKKSEELKRREQEIISDISNGNQLVDEDYLDRLKEDNIEYKNLLNRVDELSEEKFLLIRDINVIYEELKEYKFINKYGKNLKERLINLKYEQRSNDDKINAIQKTLLEINACEKEISNKRKVLEDYQILKDNKEKIESIFKEYKNKLYEVKSIAENKDSKQLNMKDNVTLILSIILALVGVTISFLGIPYIILGIILIIGSGFLIYKSIINKSRYSNINNLSQEVSNIEAEINNYCKLVNAKDYRELLSKLRMYNNFLEYEERANLIIMEKKNSISNDEYNKLLRTQDNNRKFIVELIKESGCKNLEDILNKINKYEKINLNYQRVKIELESKKRAINITKESLNNKEKEIRKKLKKIELENIEINKLEKYIDEYSIKLKRYKEIHSNLNSIEDTYKALLKDRDIEAIKRDIKDIINEDNPYSFNNEEEIEIEEKKKSKELLDCEKRIKDLENNIKNRFIGKREIVTIEEDLSIVTEAIDQNSKKLMALQKSLEVLKESFREVKREIGPEINRRIAENFKYLTNNKYSEVLLGDNYEMMVRDNNNIFKSSYLSNGAMDQLYLSLRIALIQLLFSDEEAMVILDDALIQYDDIRRGEALKLLIEKISGQIILFTCQKAEYDILMKEKVSLNYIKL